MSLLPADYHRDVEQIAAMGDRLGEKGHYSAIPITRDLATLIRAFIARWQDQFPPGPVSDSFEMFRLQLLGCESHLEALHGATLAELLDFRMNCHRAGQVLDSFHQLVDLMHRASPEDREDMERQFRDVHQSAYDDPALNARYTARFEFENSEFARLLDEYEHSWPDRMDDPHLVRILHVDPAEYDGMAEELALIVSAQSA